MRGHASRRKVRSQWSRRLELVGLDLVRSQCSVPAPLAVALGSEGALSPPLGPFGHIHGDDTRAQAWVRVFGGIEVPLRSSIPVSGRGPDGEPDRFFLVDIDRLTSDQFGRVVEYISTTFGLPTADVERDLRDPAHGLPILAEGVVVSFDGRFL